MNLKKALVILLLTQSAIYSINDTDKAKIISIVSNLEYQLFLQKDLTTSYSNQLYFHEELLLDAQKNLRKIRLKSTLQGMGIGAAAAVFTVLAGGLIIYSVLHR